MFQFSYDASRGSHLIFETVAKQPGLVFVSTHIQLFNIVVAVFDAADELQSGRSEGDLNPARYSGGLRTGNRVMQGSNVRIKTETPFIARSNPDTCRMSQTRHRIAALVALFKENAGTVREA